MVSTSARRTSSDDARHVEVSLAIDRTAPRVSLSPSEVDGPSDVQVTLPPQRQLLGGLNPRLLMYGQLVCRDDPNPVDSEDWAAENKISGDLQLTYNCGGFLAGKGPSPINGRTWSHIR